jgi:hypothetical protein
MSVKVQKNGLLPLEKSTIKLEKVLDSALILEKGLFLLKQGCLASVKWIVSLPPP